jgi:hypothetical protein
MEDYSVAAGYRTLLPADTHVPFAGKVTASPAQSILHDQDVSRVFRDFDPSTFLLCSELFPYSPGMLNGLWEGHYMVRSAVLSVATDAGYPVTGFAFCPSFLVATDLA